MPRLKTEMLVSAALRLADRHAISAAIMHRGDPDAGALFLEIEKGMHQAKLLCRVTAFDGGYEWLCIGEDGWQLPIDIQELVARERDRDPDCWVVSVQDAQGRNIFALLDDEMS